MKQRSKQYNTVLKNFGYLSILNILEMVLPLIIIPFITNAIGVSKFGIYSYVLIIVQNINLLTQYGFQFSVTKKISQNRTDMSYVSHITTTVLSARLILAIAIVLILLMLSPLIFESEGSLFMFLSAIGMIIGDVFVPTWLFQGMERMKYVTIANATSKCLFTLLVLIAIRQPEDYKYILLYNSIGYILAGIVSMILAKKQFGISYTKPYLSEIIKELKEGAALFGSTIGINLYRNMNVIILHFFVSDAALGIYALAEKVIKASQALINPIAQALFPHISMKIKDEGIESSIRVIYKSASIIAMITFFTCIFIWLFSDILVYITGKDFGEVKPIMTIMYPVLTFGCVNYLLGFVGLVNLGMQKQFLFSVLTSGTVALLLLLCTASSFGIISAAVSISLSEIMLTVICLYFLQHRYYYTKTNK